MKHRSKFKITFLVLSVSAILYAAQALAPRLASEAFASSARKGVPIEMVISADDFQKMRQSDKRFILFDVRGKTFYEESHIPGAILPLAPAYYEQESLFKKGLVGVMPDYNAALAENMKHYPKSTPIIAYCETGCQASAGFVLTLRRMGYNQTMDMEEGLSAWKKKGYPVESF